MTRIKLATWNIAGARPIASLDRFDYGKENIIYFAEQLKKIKADIVCLQETHFGKNRSISLELSNMLKMKYVYECPAGHLSHIDSKYELGMAILSAFPIKQKNNYKYPDVPFGLYFPEGNEAENHYKFLQIVSINNIYIANTQLQPLRLFGYSYKSGEGGEYSKKLENVLLKLRKPSLLCGDFNINKPLQVFDKVKTSLSLQEALPNKITRPEKNGEKRRPDHILYSTDIQLINSDIVKVQADHYLCWAEFDFEHDV